jgi:hypothetical protein
MRKGRVDEGICWNDLSYYGTKTRLRKAYARDHRTLTKTNSVLATPRYVLLCLFLFFLGVLA